MSKSYKTTTKPVAPNQNMPVEQKYAYTAAQEESKGSGAPVYEEDAEVMGVAPSFRIKNGDPNILIAINST